MIKRKLSLGKVDYYGNGRKSCLAELEYELTDDNVFTMSAQVWNSKHTDIVTGGQCVDYVLKLAHLSGCPKYKRMIAIWQEYHLNDMKAGCTHQRALEWDKVRISPTELPNSHANKDAKGIIATWVYKTEHPMGLLCEPCPTCGYKYGSSWLKEEIPQCIIDEIKSW